VFPFCHVLRPLRGSTTVITSAETVGLRPTSRPVGEIRFCYTSSATPDRVQAHQTGIETHLRAHLTGLVTEPPRLDSHPPGTVLHNPDMSPEATTAILKPDNNPDAHNHPRVRIGLQRASVAREVVCVFDTLSVLCFHPRRPIRE